jgi:hypothetical protein
MHVFKLLLLLLVFQLFEESVHG